ncbi:MAG: SH3 domain-containing protein [Bdellovibrionaceae bacterium]|nr:SH3 domain-containing protein [Pseudobdellovibrionaceae bacterium]
MLNVRFFAAPVSLAALIFFGGTAQAETLDLKVTANPSLRVRTLNGEHFCSLRQGTIVTPIGRVDDGERVRVQLTNAPNCRPNTGYVDKSYLRSVQTGHDGYEQSEVNTDGLSLRSSPRVDESTYKCALSRATKVDILEEPRGQAATNWLRVKLVSPISGCPNEGWVSASYLRPALDLDSLPVVREDRRGRTEQCTDCELAPGRRRGTDATADAARAIESRARSAEAGQSPFITALNAIKNNRGRCPRGSAYPCNRGLIQMPLVGRNAAFCGSNHYNPDSPPGSDAYAAPHTACALGALAQEWKKTACPGGGGCRLSWGDISHKTRPRWNGHVSHTDGECIDIRPFNVGEFSNTGRTWQSRGYDRQKTRDFINMARRMGASPIFFNDRQLRKEGRSGYASGHENHIHICFKNNRTTQATCNNFRVDPAVCPELQ